MSSSLHNHDMYSLRDGYGTPKEMLEQAKKIGLKAFAITNHGNLYASPYYDKLKKDYPEVKVIHGVEFYEAFDVNIKDKNSKYFHLIALAKNENGRKALNNLITQSEFYGKYFKPRIDLKMLKPYAKDLIITTACLASKIAREKDEQKCVTYINEYKSICPHFYLEMQSHSHIDQVKYNQKILRLSQITNTPFIITTDSHAVIKEHLKYQARHVQIAQDNDTINENYEGCYLQTDDEIHSVMDSQIGYENVCKGLEETDKIADMIDVVNIPFQSPVLPTFPLPDGFKSNKEYLRYLCEKGWEYRRIGEMSIEEQTKRKERLEYELNVIDTMGFNGYFLIVEDFMTWGRNNDVIFGEGRGSGAGSFVCYLLRITNADPITYGLIFERFLNPERISMPDIDIDTHPKEKIVEYLKGKYGNMRVCQVMNFAEITPVLAIKDVARILDKDKDRLEKYGAITNKIANQISKYFDIPETTFDECMEINSDSLAKYQTEKYKDLFDIARALSGRIRHVSTHAGGVGIVDTDINDYMPMKLTDKNEQVIQVDKIIVEEIGIVKFDILGLKTLSVIKETKELAKISDWELNPNNLTFLKNEKMFELLKSAKTNCVFQVESQGMKDLMKRIQPNNIMEVCDILALYRPDSMGILEDYIKRKNGEEEITYIHKDMKPILESTYGCMVYQEQLMDIVRVFGGRTYGGADKFRKGIGKKDKNLVKAEADKLYQEIIDNGYPEKIAKTISDEMREKGGYLFNKPHSLSYAITALQTAYLKSNCTTEFFCAVLNNCDGETSKINKYIIEAKEFGVEVVQPHINKSKDVFTINEGKILFGLQSINGIGEAVVKSIIEERNKGKFTNLNDVLNRVKLNKTQVVALIKSGAIPTKNKRNMIIEYGKTLINTEITEYKPYTYVKSLPSLIELKSKWDIDVDKIKDKEERLLLYNQKREIEHNTTKKEEWLLKQNEKKKEIINEFKEKYLQDEMFWEFETLSMFLHSNPFEKYQDYITQDFYEVEVGDDCIIVGIISKVQKKKDKYKRQYAYINVCEIGGLLEGICFSSVYDAYISVIKKQEKLVFYGEKSSENTFVVKKIKTIDEWLSDIKVTLR